MAAGRTYTDALTELGISRRANVRNACPPAVHEAAAYLVRELAASCGASREWILTQLVELYRRASRSVAVLDRRGEPTGEYRFDGATAARCLELLGNQAGMFGKRVVHDVSQDVRELMRAVAERGKPALPAPGAPGRILEQQEPTG